MAVRRDGDIFPPIIGESSSLREAVRDVERAAQFPFLAILIVAETGTGKELLAERYHSASRRRGAFVPVNCAAIPENLVESELFGVEKGAFTGALRSRPGLIEQADGGTRYDSKSMT